MSNLTVSPATLAITFSLVLFAIFISYKQKLGITKDIIWGISRAIVQLTVVGYLLKYIFGVNNVWLTFAMVVIIVLNAAWNSSKRSNGLPNAFKISVLAMSLSTAVCLSILILSGSLKVTPSQIVPITGMTASNAMVASGLAYRSMDSLFRDQHQQVMEKLALGATPAQATKSIVREAIKTGMTPTIDSSKTLGLVSLPGMMSGLIFAGVDPVKAIGYQIMVTFMLLATTSLSSITVVYLGYKQFYNQEEQLVR